MACNFIICLDMDELGGGELKANQLYFTNDEHRIQQYIHNLSMNWPNNTICVFRLNQLQKLKTQPTYQLYSVTKEGEVIPV